MSRKLSLVLPCFNEAKAIPQVLNKLLESRSTLLAEANLSELEIIVVDDGSTDDSKNQLSLYKPNIEILTHTNRLGYGQALKTGFQAATGDIIGFYDLDDTCQPTDLLKLLAHQSASSSFLICGNRLALSNKMPLQRWIGNRFYQLLTWILLRRRVSDCCSGYRVFSSDLKALFISTLPNDLNFSLAMTIAFIRLGGVYTEIPVVYKERIGPSKLSVFWDGPLFLATLLFYCLSPRFSKRVLLNNAINS